MIHRTRKLLQRVSLPWWGRDRGPTPSDHVQAHPDFPPTTPLPHTPQDGPNPTLVSSTAKSPCMAVTGISAK